MATVTPQAMEPRAIYDLVAAELGDAVSDFTEGGGVKDPFCLVKPDRLVDVATFMRDASKLRFDFLQCLTGVDYPKEEKLVSVYHLFSYRYNHSFVLKVELARDNPRLPSVAGVWSTADWHEREAYDLFGILYTGHPDLRRIMMPDDWVGHPMRKDYKEPAEYRGMSTSRYSVLEMLSVYDKQHPPAQVRHPKVVEDAADSAAAKE